MEMKGSACGTPGYLKLMSNLPCILHGPAHRVARQFGMDQDVPDYVPRFNYRTKGIAWKNYCRPISDTSILREMLPHARYAKWWKKTVPSHQDFAKNIVQSGGSPKSPHSAPHVSKANTNGNDADFPPGFLPKPVSTVYFGKSGKDHSNARKGNSDADAPSGFLKSLKTATSGNSYQDGLKDKEKIDTNGDVPTICKNLSNQSSSASTAVYENIKRKSPLTKLVSKDTVEPLMGVWRKIL
ncbi:hypothetical protein GYH30_023014 [Glycine max]|uniref:Aminotransferase-like plant mobile domain-containing protein n=1 Tax=Glycine max TaxID=3847 RepID=A0A0R0IV47_SOYBN|nr:hypothetical protein GYH30_023014 [Glycine max]